MHTRPLDSIGPQISALGLGYMGMSALYGDADRSSWSGRTSRVTGAVEAAAVAGPGASTTRPTGAGTPSSGASTG